MEATIQNTTLALTKNMGYAAWLVASIEYLHITPESAAVLAGLIVTDVVTGIMKSVTLEGWQSVKSSVFERGLVAKSILVVAPITIALAGKGVGIDLGVVAQSVVSLLVLSEAYSIIANLYCIQTGNPATEFDAVSYVLGTVKEALKKIIVEDAGKK